ncbi:MAG: radical SAM protein [Candidatus Aminicenantia bacterium]
MKEKIEKIGRALNNLSKNRISCRLCPRSCGVNRATGEKGFCETGDRAIVAHYGLHFGEEPPISGYYEYRQALKSSSPQRGSGTIFFAGCNLKCIFCQNYQISWNRIGEEVSDQELAEMMLHLQEKKAININLVSPTHVILPILRALKLAYQRGLNIPVVYNSNGYELLEAIKNLEGIVDIYLPDFKYFIPEVSFKFSGVTDYSRVAKEVIREMYFQAEELKLDEEENALKGLIIRHLVLPGHLEETFKILDWISNNLSTNVWLSIMSQYHPCHKAREEINRELTPEEYQKVLEKLDLLSFKNVFVQPETFKFEEHLVPDFTQKEPFSWSSSK